MGNVQGTTASCQLCNLPMPEPVALKCGHTFCRRCLEDLWSFSPCKCPKWKCTAEYDTPPFERGVRGPSTSRGATPGTSGLTEDRDPLLRRPSFSSKLLGKRKATTAEAEQPNKRQPTAQSLGKTVTSDKNPPSSSSASSSSGSGTQSRVTELPDEAGREGPAPYEQSSDSVVDLTCSDARSGNKEPIIIASQPESQGAVQDCDSSSEVDICDAPSVPTPQRDAGRQETPTKPSSSKTRVSFGFSTPERVSSRGHFGKPASSPRSPVSSSSAGSAPSSPLRRPDSPVMCHYCPRLGQQAAVKTCLVCGASMCAEHMRPHLDSPVFQSHTLVAPMEDTSSWRCQEHQEMNRIYCRDCNVCVCTVCTVIGSHRSHVCISIREAEREMRESLRDQMTHLQHTESELITRVAELEQKRKVSQEILDKARAAIKQQYSTFREALEQEEQEALQCVMMEESKAVGGLEAQLGNLQRSQLSVSQAVFSLEVLADAKGDKQDQAFIAEYNRSVQTLNGLEECVELVQPVLEVNQARLRCLQRWTEKRMDTIITTKPDRDLYIVSYGAIPLLDADTAHPKLLLSNDERTVTYSETPRAYVEAANRFTSFPQVLAINFLERGCHYWEVNVAADEGRWKVGVCEGLMERKGQKDAARLGYNSKSWCLSGEKEKVEALHNKEALPLAAGRPQKVGVFLDLDDGTLSFYNVTAGGSMVLFHCYKHQFIEPLYPALSVSKTQLTICDLFQSYAE